VSNLLLVVSEPSRQEILRLIWNTERSAGDIAGRFETSFGAVSQHLHVLRDAGLVELRKQGRMRYYRARRENLGPLAKYLEEIWGMHLGKLKELAEAEEGR
jgi:DNA-binding transcriptional ArsR family regulator